MAHPEHWPPKIEWRNLLTVVIVLAFVTLFWRAISILVAGFFR